MVYAIPKMLGFGGEAMIKLLDLEDPHYVASAVYRWISDEVRRNYGGEFEWIDEEGVRWAHMSTRTMWREMPFVSMAAIEKAIQTLEEDGQILVREDPYAGNPKPRNLGREFYTLPNGEWKVSRK